jgi:hypothetical protein
MTAPDDLTNLFAGAPLGPSQDVHYRQGVIVEWDPLDASNIVDVGGNQFVDLPILNTTEALLLQKGAVVAVLVIGHEGAKTFAILGRLTIPGSEDAASALALARTSSADVATAETTTSNTYTDLATVGPTLEDVLIGPSGRCLVTVGSEIRGTAITGQATATGAGFMSYEITGATSVSPVDQNALQAWIRYNASPNSTLAIDIRVGASRTTLQSGLSPGLHTFQAKYRRNSDTTVTFVERNLTVIPL